MRNFGNLGLYKGLFPCYNQKDVTFFPEAGYWPVGSSPARP